MFNPIVIQSNHPRRDEVLDYICRYARDHNGATPAILQIAREFHLSYSTIRGHVCELAMERKLRLEDRQIVVEDSSWTPPPYFAE
jgi:hypothetical protein